MTTKINGIAAWIALAIGAPALAHGASFFSNTTGKFASASVAVDAAGGMHMAYVDYIPLAEGLQ